MELNGAQNYAFISVDRFGKPKPKDRKLIRSHCMNGKNLGIGVHPVPTDRDTSRSGKPPWEFKQQARNISLLLRHAKRRRLPKERLEEARICLPPPSPSDLSLGPFAAELDEYSRMLIFNCTMSIRLLPLRDMCH